VVARCPLRLELPADFLLVLEMVSREEERALVCFVFEANEAETNKRRTQIMPTSRLKSWLCRKPHLGGMGRKLLIP
jgi:hypothetical protein